MQSLIQQDSQQRELMLQLHVLLDRLDRDLDLELRPCLHGHLSVQQVQWASLAPLDQGQGLSPQSQPDSGQHYRYHAPVQPIHLSGLLFLRDYHAGQYWALVQNHWQAQR